MKNIIQRTANKLGQSLIILAICSTVLSGCVTALVAGAAIATIDILHDRRSAGEYVDDSTIELTANNYLISSKELRGTAHVKPISFNGILLVTGEIDSEQLKPEIISTLRSIEGVRQLVDETTITGKSALGTRTNDTWITTKVKSRLVLKTGIDANRIKVVTVRGSVYLMGIVSEEEANRATELVRTVKGVKRVVKVFEYEGAVQAES